MEKILKTLDALSDKTRLRIFLLLLNGNLCVCELVSILGMKQARVSRILKKLHDSGLVAGRRSGKRVVYSIVPEAMKLGIVSGLLDDIKISASDLKKLKECRRCGVREKCRVGKEK